MNLDKYAKLTWYYSAEMVLAAMCTVFIWILTSESSVNDFLHKTVGDWISVAGQVLFPASVAVLTVYVNLSTGRFGDYLNKLGKEKFYLHGFTWPVAIFAATTLCLIFFRGIESGEVAQILRWATIYLLFWSGAASVVMIANLVQVVRLFRKFQLLLEEINKKS